MKGNEAMAEAAVRAGCRLYAGYPITPQTEILEYLAKRMPEVGGSFMQCESELAGISAVYGAAGCGLRTLTSSSGPGFSLLQEGISFLASAELPSVLINVQRYGSGLGDIFHGQSDYLQTVKNGGHSDYRCLVLAPNSVQEAYDLVVMAYEKAEKYRTPVIILSDASISQMMEPVQLGDFYEHDPDKFEWAMKGTKDGKFVQVTSNMYYIKDYENYIRNKYQEIKDNEERWEEVHTEDAEIVLVAYGISSRVAKETVTIARKQGIKLGLIRPISLWPFPNTPFRKLKNVKAYLAIEMTALGQMIEDVAIACEMRTPVYGFLSGQVTPDSQSILAYIEKIQSKSVKEVYKASC